MKNASSWLLISLWFFLTAIPGVSQDRFNDSPFDQEYHEAYPIGDGREMNDVRAVAIDPAGLVWAATKAGVYQLDTGSKTWISQMSPAEAGPAFDLIVDPKGEIWAAAWNGVYHSTPNGMEKVKGIEQPIAAIGATGDEIIAIGPDGWWSYKNGIWSRKELSYCRSVRRVLTDKQGGWWIATSNGLYHQTGSDLILLQNEDALLSSDVHDVAYADDGRLWIGGLGGITIYQDNQRLSALTPENGLPSVFVRSVTQGPNGRMWIGTENGLARLDGKDWSWRHSRRWLLSDDVRELAFDADGTAWIATANGVSAIKHRSMTLAQKANYFDRICQARHVREPGLVEKCLLTTPGDTSSWQPRDDDNDGQYTAMYLTMESFRYAATRDPRAKANAKRAFEALRFLQTVTETPGFVARTVIPSTWNRMADPNVTWTDQEWADNYVQSPREKRVEKRWRPSHDGKWLWKGDTSSDEITGYMFGYLFYYDLVADQAERKIVAKHVTNIVDYIIAGGLVMKDIDGKHTRWAVWAPEKLNHDPDWAAERGVNSVEILSFLKLAEHVTGDKRYQKEYRKLFEEHKYGENVRRAKTLGLAWRTHIDDELLALAYPCLMLYEKDKSLRQIYRESMDRWYGAVKDDCSPFFDFVYQAFAGQHLNLKNALFALRDTPLDLIRWRIDNSQREDITLVRRPEIERLQTSRLLPPSERCTMRWDNNPWDAVEGDGGHTESDGVFWLLPYWVGRYYGFVAPPE